MQTVELNQMLALGLAALGPMGKSRKVVAPHCGQVQKGGRVWQEYCGREWLTVKVSELLLLAWGTRASESCHVVCKGGAPD